MQYPPQQPTNSPYFPPAEVYQSEQRQEYAPRETAQPLVFGQTIAVYANRRQAAWRVAITAIGLVLVVGLLILLSVIVFFFAHSLDDTTISSTFLPIFGFLLVCLLAESVFIGRILWRWCSTLLFNREPLLVIDRKGITVRRTPTLSGFFIAWNEIEALGIQSFLYKYFCIRPRNEKQFLTRFNPWERFLRLSNSVFGIPLLIIPQIYLDKPVEEILQQVYYIYAYELSYYHISFRL